jgi:electron transfer flavoprotein beta subunit
MQIYVCIKHVPDTAANIKIVGRAEFNEALKFVINPYDEYGLEEAVKIVEKTGKGEVVVVTVGKEAAVSTIRSALSKGAHRGILVKTDTHFIDSALTSMALKKAIEQDGVPDLIFMGKQSVDSEGLQTHYRLAAAFNMPVATDVVHLEINNGKVMIEREVGGGSKEVVEMSTPCVIGATKGLNEPRYPKTPDILKAKKKEIKQVGIDNFGIDLSSGKSRIVELESVPERSEAKMLHGSPREATEQLVKILMEEKII